MHESFKQIERKGWGPGEAVAPRDRADAYATRLPDRRFRDNGARDALPVSPTVREKISADPGRARKLLPVRLRTASCGLQFENDLGHAGAVNLSYRWRLVVEVQVI